MGGSYPGALVAWFAHVYPEQVKAVWSSSGVIDAIIDFTDYDLDIYETTHQSGNGCTDAIITVYK